MASLKRPPHLLTLADLTPIQIYKILGHAAQLKRLSSPLLQRARVSHSGGLLSDPYYSNTPRKPLRTLESKSIALLFSKRSTRTRLAAETAAFLLGGQAVFMGREDVQMGVNESVRDTVRVVGGMCQGIFARVGEHSEIEEMVKYAEVPIVNALSSLWHPTQVLADLLTLHQQPEFQIPMPGLDASNTNTPPPPDTETEPLLYPPPPSPPNSTTPNLKPDPSYTQTFHNLSRPSLPPIRPLTIAYIGDSANVLHDMLVTYPRLGHSLRVASPPDPKYRAPDVVWERVVEGGGDRDWVAEGRKGIVWVEDPREAVRGADVVVTDTWISMGSEHETPARLAAFSGYEVTESLCLSGGANPGWKFMHCLPRHKEEVDDEVFYGPRSLVFPEAENRKWTIMAVFDYIFGRQMLPSTNVPSVGAYAKESQGLQGLRGESRERERERGYGGGGRSNRDNRELRESNYRDNRDARDRDNRDRDRDARVQRQGQGRIDPIDRELERLERQLERVRSRRAQNQGQNQGQSQSGRGMERARMRASASAGIANANTNTIAANFANANTNANTNATELVGLEGYENSDIDNIYTDTDIHDNNISSDIDLDNNIQNDPNIHNDPETDIHSDPETDPETHTQMDGAIGTGPLHVPGRDAGRNMGKAERIGGVGVGGGAGGEV